MEGSIYDRLIGSSARTIYRDIENRMEGRADFPLTELGHAQAKKLAEWINKHYLPDIILSSPLKRASQTANYIADQNDIEVEYLNDLMEIDTGLVGGLLRTEANEKYPVPQGGFKPHDVRGMTGESEIAVRARAEVFLGKLLIEKENNRTLNRICIVSHGYFIDMLFRSFLNLPMDSNVRLNTNDTGVHLWKVNGCEKRVVFTNYQEHLKQWK